MNFSNRKVFIILLLFISLQLSWAQEVFRFSIKCEIDYPVWQTDQTIEFLDENVILLDEKSLILVDSNTGNLIKRYRNTGSLYGILNEEKFIVKLPKTYEIGIYDVKNNFGTLLGLNINIGMTRIIAYNNELFFSSESVMLAPGDMSEEYKAFEYNINSKTLRYINAPGIPISISNDKLHILMDRGYITNKRLFVWNTEQEIITTELINSDIYGLSTAFFVTDHLILGALSEKKWGLWSIKGEKLSEFILTTQRGRSLSKIVFNKDLSKALIAYRLPKGGGHTKTAIVDTSTFKERLDIINNK